MPTKTMTMLRAFFPVKGLSALKHLLTISQHDPAIGQLIPSVR
jgi:hypothetical protein